VGLDRVYRAEVGRHCRANPCDENCAGVVRAAKAAKDCVPVCDPEPRPLPDTCDVAPSELNARFFAVQTITTTGYGSEVFLNVPEVQEMSFWGMIAGALCWALFTAAFFSVLTTGGSKRPVKP
jgi:hypothetical protein